MKLLFTGASHAPRMTFMRLLLVAEEIAFLDRPGVTFGLGDGQWGTVGAPSPVRGYAPAIEQTQSPVKITVHDAPFSGLVGEFLQRCVDADLANPLFRQILLEGAYGPAFLAKVPLARRLRQRSDRSRYSKCAFE